MTSWQGLGTQTTSLKSKKKTNPNQQIKKTNQKKRGKRKNADSGLVDISFYRSSSKKKKPQLNISLFFFPFLLFCFKHSIENFSWQCNTEVVKSIPKSAMYSSIGKTPGRRDSAVVRERLSMLRAISAWKSVEISWLLSVIPFSLLSPSAFWDKEWSPWVQLCAELSAYTLHRGLVISTNKLGLKELWSTQSSSAESEALWVSNGINRPMMEDVLDLLHHQFVKQPHCNLE